MSPRIVRALCAVAAICLLFFAPGRARADEIAVGGQVIVGSETHVEGPNSAIGHDPLPLAVLDARFKRVEVSGEWVPPITGNVPNNPVGIHKIQLTYFDGSVRYWLGDRRWCVGLGQTLWNQQTEYLYRPVQFDASRGVGVRYELGNAMPVFKHDSIETIVAATPAIHAQLSYTFQEPGFAAPPVSEQESQIDLQAALVQPRGRWRFKYGVRYMNMTAKFDDGSFADANHVVGVFVTALYRFHF